MKCPPMSAIYFNFNSIINIALKTTNDEMAETISVVLKTVFRCDFCFTAFGTFEIPCLLHCKNAALSLICTEISHRAGETV